MRVWHPDLTATEIKAITFLFDCVDDSDIILHPDGLAMYDMMKVWDVQCADRVWEAMVGDSWRPKLRSTMRMIFLTGMWRFGTNF